MSNRLGSDRPFQISAWPFVLHSSQGDQASTSILWPLFQYERNGTFSDLRIHPFLFRLRREHKNNNSNGNGGNNNSNSGNSGSGGSGGTLEIMILFWSIYFMRNQESRTWFVLPLLLFSRSALLFDPQSHTYSTTSRLFILFGGLIVDYRYQVMRSYRHLFPIYFSFLKRDAVNISDPTRGQYLEIVCAGWAFWKYDTLNTMIWCVLPFLWRFKNATFDILQVWPLYGTQRRTNAYMEYSTLYPLFRVRHDKSINSRTLHFPWPFLKIVHKFDYVSIRFLPFCWVRRGWDHSSGFIFLYYWVDTLNYRTIGIFPFFHRRVELAPGRADLSTLAILPFVLNIKTSSYTLRFITPFHFKFWNASDYITCTILFYYQHRNVVTRTVFVPILLYFRKEHFTVRKLFAICPLFWIYHTQFFFVLGIIPLLYRMTRVLEVEGITSDETPVFREKSTHLFVPLLSYLFIDRKREYSLALMLSTINITYDPKRAFYLFVLCIIHLRWKFQRRDFQCLIIPLLFYIKLLNGRLLDFHLLFPFLGIHLLPDLSLVHIHVLPFFWLRIRTKRTHLEPSRQRHQFVLVVLPLFYHQRNKQGNQLTFASTIFLPLLCGFMNWAIDGVQLISYPLLLVVTLRRKNSLFQQIPNQPKWLWEATVALYGLIGVIIDRVTDFSRVWVLGFVTFSRDSATSCWLFVSILFLPPYVFVREQTAGRSLIVVWPFFGKKTDPGSSSFYVLYPLIKFRTGGSSTSHRDVSVWPLFDYVRRSESYRIRLCYFGSLFQLGLFSFSKQPADAISAKITHTSTRFLWPLFFYEKEVTETRPHLLQFQQQTAQSNTLDPQSVLLQLRNDFPALEPPVIELVFANMHNDVDKTVQYLGELSGGIPLPVLPSEPSSSQSRVISLETEVEPNQTTTIDTSAAAVVPLSESNSQVALENQLPPESPSEFSPPSTQFNLFWITRSISLFFYQVDHHRQQYLKEWIWWLVVYFSENSHDDHSSTQISFLYLFHPVLALFRHSRSSEKSNNTTIRETTTSYIPIVFFRKMQLEMRAFVSGQLYRETTSNQAVCQHQQHQFSVGWFGWPQAALFCSARETAPWIIHTLWYLPLLLFSEQKATFNLDTASPPKYVCSTREYTTSALWIWSKDIAISVAHSFSSNAMELETRFILPLFYWKRKRTILSIPDGTHRSESLFSLVWFVRPAISLFYRGINITPSETNRKTFLVGIFYNTDDMTQRERTRRIHVLWIAHPHVSFLSQIRYFCRDEAATWELQNLSEHVWPFWTRSVRSDRYQHTLQLGLVALFPSIPWLSVFHFSLVTDNSTTRASKVSLFPIFRFHDTKRTRSPHENEDQVMVESTTDCSVIWCFHPRFSLFFYRTRVAADFRLNAMQIAALLWREHQSHSRNSVERVWLSLFWGFHSHTGLIQAERTTTPNDVTEKMFFFPFLYWRRTRARVADMQAQLATITSKLSFGWIVDAPYALFHVDLSHDLIMKSRTLIVYAFLWFYFFETRKSDNSVWIREFWAVWFFRRSFALSGFTRQMLRHGDAVIALKTRQYMFPLFSRSVRTVKGLHQSVLKIMYFPVNDDTSPISLAFFLRRKKQIGNTSDSLHEISPTDNTDFRLYELRHAVHLFGLFFFDDTATVRDAKTQHRHRDLFIAWILHKRAALVHYWTEQHSASENHDQQGLYIVPWVHRTWSRKASGVCNTFSVLWFGWHKIALFHVATERGSAGNRLLLYVVPVCYVLHTDLETVVSLAWVGFSKLAMMYVALTRRKALSIGSGRLPLKMWCLPLFYFSRDETTTRFSVIWLFFRQIAFMRFTREQHLSKSNVFPIFKYVHKEGDLTQWCIVPFVPVKFSFVACLLAYEKFVRRDERQPGGVQEDRHVRLLYRVLRWSRKNRVVTLECNPFFTWEHDEQSDFSEWNILGGTIGRQRERDNKRCRLCCFWYLPI